MFKFGFIFFLLSFNYSFSISNTVIPKNLEEKLDKVLIEYFNGFYDIKEPINLSKEALQESKLNHADDLIFRIKDKKSNSIGYAYLGKAKSKVALFDYVVIFDKNLIITQVKVLIYREDHGGEIASKRWLKQFLGFEKNQNIIYKKDIAGISGATISAASLTNSVNNVLKTMDILYQLKQL
ncbi:MAG: FMN-binding protein [Flavobacteriaceae bacterium]|nr:FMN-binding protein [Flavobacteriaceae bacterium]